MQSNLTYMALAMCTIQVKKCHSIYLSNCGVLLLQGSTTTSIQAQILYYTLNHLTCIFPSILRLASFPPRRFKPSKLSCLHHHYSNSQATLSPYHPLIPTRNTTNNIKPISALHLHLLRILLAQCTPKAPHCCKTRHQTPFHSLNHP